MLKQTLKAKITVSVLLILVIAGSLSVISNFLINSKIDCTVNSCSEMFNDNQVIQSVEISFLNKSGEYREELETKNSIKISKIEGFDINDVEDLKIAENLVSIKKKLI